MKISNLRIATRKSPLALWQACHVQELLQQHYPELLVTLVTMTTQGDKLLETPLSDIGGKGLFTKELEQGLLENQADIAVHSMKDVPIELPPGLDLPVILAREEPFDAFVAPKFRQLADLPIGAKIGTTSLRRQSQLLALRPDLEIKPLRGNVGTRLNKLMQGDYDAIILALAGLRRLEMEQHIRTVFTPDELLPAIGQGAIGLECRQQDAAVQELIAPLNHTDTQIAVQSERAFNRRLGGNCQLPVAGFAELRGQNLLLRGLVAQLRGQRILRGQVQGASHRPVELGQQLAEQLLEEGAAEFLTAAKQALI